jgi:hypothetical protein
MPPLFHDSNASTCDQFHRRRKKFCRIFLVRNEPLNATRREGRGRRGDPSRLGVNRAISSSSRSHSRRPPSAQDCPKDVPAVVGRVSLRQTDCTGRRWLLSIAARRDSCRLRARAARAPRPDAQHRVSVRGRHFGRRMLRSLLARERGACEPRCNLLEHRQPLAGDAFLVQQEACEIAARPRQARNQA